MKELDELRGSLVALTALIHAMMEARPNPTGDRDRFVELSEQGDRHALSDHRRRPNAIGALTTMPIPVTVLGRQRRDALYGPEQRAS